MDWASQNNEPSHRNGENCIALYRSDIGWKWGDFHCGAFLGYICEKYLVSQL